MPILGPLDRRTQRKRCVACTRRKIKCEGGSPCLYCIKKNQTCIPPAAAPKTDAVFVHTSATPPMRNTSNVSIVVQKKNHAIQNPIPALCLHVPHDKSIIFVRHFFSSFLVANDFGAHLDLDTIIAQFQTSPSLYHTLVAVGALDLSNKPLSSCPASLIIARDARVGALTAYRSSIVSFQKDIIESEQHDVRHGDASLWTTFFLGLFELMYDDTGDGFVKHFLYGTYRILQLRGPEAHLSGPGKAFFQTVRIFEVCRALIFAEPTFLAEPGWRKVMERIWDDSETWHPKEALFDLMITCSSLSHRVWEVLKPDSIYPPLLLEDKLQELAAEGLVIRTALNDWNINFQQWSEATKTTFPDSESVIAILYFHAISIFLSGIFDYHPQFHNHHNNKTISPPPPTLSQNHIQNHVDMIISTTQIALKTTNLGGVLFFFPLRVAGARVTSKHEAAAIVDMLDEISKRSFVVAAAFVADLKDIWLCEGL